MTARSEGTVLAAIGRFGRDDDNVIGTTIASRRGLGPSQSLFKLQQLAHEIEIWRNDWTTLFDHRVGFDQAQLGVTHQVSDGDSRRTGDASVAMNQHCSAAAPCFIYKEKEKKRSLSKHLGNGSV